jgi:hypothetical protein
MNALLDEMRKRIEEEIEKPLPFFEVEFLERIRTLDDLRALVPIAKELQPIAWDAARILGASDEEAGYIAGDDILAPKPVEVKPPEPVVLHNYDYRNMDRKTQNAILKQNGYWWRKITEDEIEDFGWFDTEPGWHLYSSDKREVSVRRAFDEINRGVEIVALEIAEREAAENRAIEHKRQVKTRASQIADYIRSTGEYPAGDHLPEGDRMLDTQNIYGGGDWFVVGQKYIWYVQNNGMDGDNWSRNNVATGGAGGIGHRIEFDQAIADELRRLNAGEL